MSYVAALDNEKQAGRYKTRIIIGLFVIIFVMAIGWGQAPKHITLHYPPDLRSGATMKMGEVDSAGVYLFAQYIVQQINSWDVNGEQDYPNRISMLRYYLTPNYHQHLTEDANNRKAQGELKNRVRTLSFVAGSAYQDKFVQVDGNAWIVWFDVHIKEHVLGNVVKDVTLRYPIRVVRYDVDREQNPWQLALDGSGHFQPIRVED